MSTEDSRLADELSSILGEARIIPTPGIMDLAFSHAQGIKPVFGKRIVSGSLVKNSSGVYGIVMAWSEDAGTIDVAWSTGGVFRLEKLKKAIEMADRGSK